MSPRNTSNRVVDTLTIEDAQILFRNFSGKESKFNAPGNRNFCVILDAELADRLKADGWNVRILAPREEGDEPRFYMQVNVNYGGRGRPPKIVIITHRGQTIMDEHTVGMLDWADITKVDVMIRPYNWESASGRGVKGYVGTMYITIEENELEIKYGNAYDPSFENDGPQEA